VLALGLVGAAQFAIVLDASITNMAIPAMVAQLGLSDAAVSWVTNAYALTFGGFLLLGGRLVDAFGPRSLLRLGLLLFGGGSLAGGMAPTASWLIGARAVQGLGAALLAPATLALVVQLFPEGAERNRALGIWGAAAAAGAPAGAMLGGLLAGSLGWASVLFVNVPLCAVALAVSGTMASPATRRSPRLPLDVGGAAAVTIGVAALLAGVVGAARWSWRSPDTLGLLALALAALALFAVIELRVAWPLVPLSLLRRRLVASTNVVALLGPMAGYGMSFLLTLHLQRTLGLSPLLAGCAFLPYGAAAIAASSIASAFVTRFDAKPVVVAGALAMGVGLVPLVALPVGGGYLTHILPALVVFAIGDGLFFVAINAAGLREAEHHDAGLAAGLLTTSQQLGGALGLAVAVSVSQASRSASAGFAAALALALACGIVAAAWLPSDTMRR
jgi:EmrB/QacA subfamily drug resistance transporter